GAHRETSPRQIEVDPAEAQDREGRNPARRGRPIAEQGVPANREEDEAGRDHVQALDPQLLGLESDRLLRKWCGDPFHQRLRTNPSALTLRDDASLLHVRTTAACRA